ncbi:hypothetical protein GCM10009117_17790 [Gangjinia marincola]|uniref:Phenylalanyl-tRNA synthetase subunit alpha n=1 Tax=Gangjinia marincola TaxID=578463 RepID=A0ABN1MHG5_9FLAO
MRRIILLVLLLCISCKEKSQQQPQEDQLETATTSESALINKNQQTDSLLADLKAKGFQTFDYVEESTGEKVIMQQYFIAFLKSGPNRNQSKAEADSLQALHMAHLGRMYELGYADISGPFGDNGEIRGITIYNVPTLKMADSLAHLDPMVQAGRLAIEIHPWWAGKGFGLR